MTGNTDVALLPKSPKEMASAHCLGVVENVQNVVSAGKYNQEYLLIAASSIADAYEVCWKIRSNLPPTDKSHHYRHAALRVSEPAYVRAGVRWEWPSSSGGWRWQTPSRNKIYDNDVIIKLGEVRNSRHYFLQYPDPRYPLTLSEIYWALGYLLVEFEWATGQQLELIKLDLWWKIMAQENAADWVETCITKFLAPHRAKDSLFLKCPNCNRMTYDSRTDSCRTCPHINHTFLCRYDGSKHLWRDRKDFPPIPTASQIPVCTGCFRALAGLVESKLRLENIQAVKCRSCSYKCFDVRSACCLFCGKHDESWCELVLKHLGQSRCQVCRKLGRAFAWEYYQALCEECFTRIEQQEERREEVERGALISAEAFIERAERRRGRPFKRRHRQIRTLASILAYEGSP